MAEQEYDKSEKPTPFKLAEARKKGQVAKSMEVNSWLILLAAFGLFLTVGHRLVTGLYQSSAFLFSQSASIQLSSEKLSVILMQMGELMRSQSWPFFLTLAVVGAAATLVQIGFVFTFFPLKPDMKRLNPVQGFKRLFSRKLLFESFKNVLKLSLLIAVFYVVLSGVLPYFPLLLDMPVEYVYSHLLRHSSSLIASLIAVLLLIALLDLVYSRRDFTRQMMMSKREVKDEVKRREGDPLVRQKRRQTQQSLSAQLSSMANVPNADVVITNPTHLSIALQYDRENMVAPTVIAKGSGATALKIREIAKKNKIELVENKPLARTLYRKLAVNQPISAELFPAVAQVYIWLQKQKNSVVRNSAA